MGGNVSSGRLVSDWPTPRPCGDKGWTDPDDYAYVSCPADRKYESVHVRCPSCGANHTMPMDGSVPIKDGVIEWSLLNPFIVRFAQGLRAACERTEALL